MVGQWGEQVPKPKHLSLPFHLTSWSTPQLSKPEKVSIPERYVELDPEEPPSLEELQARYRKAEKIRNILARSRSALTCLTSLDIPLVPTPDGISFMWDLGQAGWAACFVNLCLR